VTYHGGPENKKTNNVSRRGRNRILDRTARKNQKAQQKSTPHKANAKIESASPQPSARYTGGTERGGRNLSTGGQRIQKNSLNHAGSAYPPWESGAKKNEKLIQPAKKRTRKKTFVKRGRTTSGGATLTRGSTRRPTL